MNKKISIIIPAYNSEKYIEKCIESVLSQTYHNLEVLLVDDGSTDKTLELMNLFASKDERIKVIHKENNGQSEARNTGIDASTGEYLIFIDSDDYVENDMVEFLYNLAEENNADVARCGFYTEYEDGTKLSQENCFEFAVLDNNERLIDLLMGGHLSGVVWNKIYKKSAISGVRFLKEVCSEDFLFNYNVFKNVSKTVFSDVPKYHYYRRSGSITKTVFNVNAFSVTRIKKAVLDELRENKEVYPYAVKSFISSAFIVMTGCIRNNACKEEYEKLRQEVLSFKKEILKSKMFGNSEKLKVILLCCFPRVYKKLIIMNGHINK